MPATDSQPEIKLKKIQGFEIMKVKQSKLTGRKDQTKKKEQERQRIQNKSKLHSI